LALVLIHSLVLALALTLLTLSASRRALGFLITLILLLVGIS
jgi:hypothetical protein